MRAFRCWADIDNATAERRFWMRVRRKSDHGCWEFNGARTQLGYGRLSLHHNRWILAHRFAWLLSHQDEVLTDVHCVLHRCDNPPCVNPNHLFLGTNADNVADMIAKGRQSRKYWLSDLRRDDPVAFQEFFARRRAVGAVGERNAMRRADVRERVGASLKRRHAAREIVIPGTTLTDDVVRQIFALRGQTRARDVAKQFATKTTLIHHIWSGRTFRAVTGMIQPINRRISLRQEEQR